MCFEVAQAPHLKDTAKVQIIQIQCNRYIAYQKNFDNMIKPLKMHWTNLVPQGHFKDAEH